MFIDPARFGVFYWIGFGGVFIFIATAAFYRCLKGSVLRRRIINELMNEVKEEEVERNGDVSLQEAMPSDL
jgi:hypothetical protein